MDQNTLTDKHWAIDGLNSAKKETSLFENIIINSIHSDIAKYKEGKNSNQTYLNKAEIFNNTTDEIKFQPPNFKKTYYAFDSKNYFTKSQNWIGYITELTSSGFIANLNDLSNKGTYEIGEFENQEISEEDKQFIAIGSVFYWSVGFANSNGQRKSESIIRFQRFSPWTSKDFDEASDRARSLLNNLKWE